MVYLCLREQVIVNSKSSTGSPTGIQEFVRAFQEKMKKETAKSQAGSTVSAIGQPYEALEGEMETKDRQIGRLVKDRDRLIKTKTMRC